MVALASLESIEAAYTQEPKCIHVANGIARIRDKGSDGDETRLPVSGKAIPLEDNTVDVLQEADDVTVRRWLKKIGNYLIHEGHWHSLPTDVQYTLKRFPKGYKLYTHLTGRKSNPRKDTYLYGSTTERCSTFRSPEEFVLHAKWLAFGKPTDERGRALCGCQYCSGRPQEEISEILREKIKHLKPEPASGSTGRPSRTGHRHASPASDVPIMAKDYTHLQRGEGVTTWVENTTPSTN